MRSDLSLVFLSNDHDHKIALPARRCSPTCDMCSIIHEHGLALSFIGVNNALPLIETNKSPLPAYDTHNSDNETKYIDETGETFAKLLANLLNDNVNLSSYLYAKAGERFDGFLSNCPGTALF